MIISVRGEYALKAMLDISSRPDGEWVKVTDIARRHKLPQKFLEAVLLALKKGGYLESRRGCDGGYRLARSADQISIGEIISFAEYTRPPRRDNHPVLVELLKSVDDAVRGVVDRVSLAEVVRQSHPATWQI